MSEAAATKAIGTIPADWRSALGEAASPAVLESIDARVAEDRALGTVYPPAEDVFAALRLTPLASVRAVILGQDPYHRPGQAHGLAFSVPDGCSPLPPSLRNIRAELLSDVGLASPPSGSLVPWARQGVLLLNTALTVREGMPGSHGGGLWSPVVDRVLAAIAAKRDPVAFLLWGRRAHDRARGIESERHAHVLSAHPSPLSAHRGFLGSRPFSRANVALVARDAAPIDWSLE
jgi:uracil-DNA glycosylase